MIQLDVIAENWGKFLFSESHLTRFNVHCELCRLVGMHPVTFNELFFFIFCIRKIPTGWIICTIKLKQTNEITPRMSQFQCTPDIHRILQNTFKQISKTKVCITNIYFTRTKTKLWWILYSYRTRANNPLNYVWGM